jgi:hypothetical protein
VVDGEVLEDLKGSSLSGNGGLLVTFLLDEDTQPALSKSNVFTDILSSMADKHLPGLLKGFCAPPELLAIDGVCQEPFHFFHKDLTSV